MMNFLRSDELQASLVELKYADSKLSFVMALPLPTSNLHQLEMNMNGNKLVDALNRMHRIPINLMMPKFKIAYGIELNDVLKQVCEGIM